MQKMIARLMKRLLLCLAVVTLTMATAQAEVFEGQPPEDILGGGICPGPYLM